LAAPKKCFDLNQDLYYLSIVATTRNDNHGGDLLRRTQAFINSVYFQSKRTSLRVELIIVEWNPPSDKPLLKDELIHPEADVPVTLRIVVVPNSIHETYRFSTSLPLYQMIAKNVGIRRASGQFVLCTNIDILFSNLNFDFLAEKRLKDGIFYRANRCDVPKQVMDLLGHDAQMEYCNENVITRLGKTQGNELVRGPSFIYAIPSLTKLLNRIIHWIFQKIQKSDFVHLMIDFMACGDYTLMSKKDWMKIEGYVELDMYSIHIDSMGLWSACAAGMKQHIIPYKAPVYHIDHEDGWESDDVIKTIKFLSDKPSLDYSIVYKAGMKMVESKTNWELNKPNWGWADEDLDEYVFEGKVSE
jgi:hypothetical protein